MAKKDKLIKRIKSKPRDFTFHEMESLLLSLGFKKSNKGKSSDSRVIFEIDNISIDIHKPHPRKEFLHYQIKDVLDILEKEGLV